MQFKDLHPKRFFLNTWNDLDAERFECRETDAFERRGNPCLIAYIFSVVTISIVLQEYIGTTPFFLDIVNFLDSPGSAVSSPLLYHSLSWLRPETGSVRSWLVTSGNYELFALCYWAFWRVLGFLIIPLIAILAHPALKKRPLGFSLKGFKEHLWVYGVLFVPVLIAVIVVSFFDEFQEYYPFYSKAHESLLDFVIWESFYIAQFFSLEFFFRGFMIQPLRREMGSGAIFAMMIPYVMIHIGKPMVECFAAILAGIVLGTLAMKTRSIWSGFLIHVSVALSMDLLSIWQKM